MRFLICSLIAIATAEAPLSAKTLVEIGVTTDGSIYSADYDSVKRSGDKAEVWVFIDHSKDRTAKARSSRELWKFYCSEETTLTAYWVSYDARGRVIRSGSKPDNPYLYEPVVPETFGSFAKNFACTAKQ